MKKLKQLIACEKNIVVSIISFSVFIDEKRLTQEKANEWLTYRFGDIKHKYGIAIFRKSLKNALERKEYKKQVEMNFGKNKRNVKILYEEAEKYYNTIP